MSIIIDIVLIPVVVVIVVAVIVVIEEITDLSVAIPSVETFLQSSFSRRCFFVAASIGERTRASE